MAENPTLNPNLKDFWLTPARYRVLYGGRSSGKSWDTAGFLIALSQMTKIRVLCTRQFQARITDSVYSLLKIQIERFNLQSKFRVLENKIICTTTGSEFLFYGLWRSIDEIKSLESIDIAWHEEAALMTESQWNVINPTIRKEGSQHFFVFNPQLATDFVWKKFIVNKPKGAIVRKINYDENPFLSKTMLDVIEAAKTEDEDDFNHVYLGEPKDTSDEAIIQRKHIIAALDAHIKLGIEIAGKNKIGFDVADAGEDMCATVSFSGSLVTGIDTWKAKEDELLKSCSRVYARAREESAMIVYDAIGVGASAGAKFNELNQQTTQSPIAHQKFFAGGSPAKPDRFYKQTKIKNRDFFANIKAQAWWITSDRLMNTYNAVVNGQEFSQDELLFIDSTIPNLEQLINELTTPKRDYDLAGRVKVESKKDLAKRDIKSPNIADAFVMIAGNMESSPMQINSEILRG